MGRVLGTEDVPWPKPGGGQYFIDDLEERRAVQIVAQPERDGIEAFTVVVPHEGTEVRGEVAIRHITPGQHKVTWSRDRGSGSFVVQGSTEKALALGIKKITGLPTSYGSSPKFV